MTNPGVWENWLKAAGDAFVSDIKTTGLFWKIINMLLLHVSASMTRGWRDFVL